jgi:hypothetical protein
MSQLPLSSSDRWVAGTGLAAAFASLPLPTHAHSPELAAILAIGSIAVLAGHRWGLGIVVLAEVFLVAAVWPLALLARPPSLAAQIAVAIAAIGAAPGIIRALRGGDDVLDAFGITGHRWRKPMLRGFAISTGAICAWPLLAGPTG